jgi:acyl-CoA synthetase (AMP-forming)/AMP-acid ligase II
LVYDADLRNVIEPLLESKRLNSISVGETHYFDSINYEELIRASVDSETDISVDEKDLRFIMYTSGTTGFPKGAMFTHRNNLWAALSIIITKKYDFNEMVLIVNPLYHMNSYINVIAGLFMGNKIVVMRRFDPLKMMRLIESEKVTICSVVPTICEKLLEVLKDHEFNTTNWRYCTSTGAPWPFGMKKAFMERFPQVVMADAYGATEVFSGTLIQGSEILEKPKSVGKPYLDTIIRIVDDQGMELQPGQIGEIIFYGPHVTQGYYNDPVATGEALRDGWFYSGDLGYFDQDGYLYLVDRKKDMIISGGENIFSLEIENVLLRNEKIMEAAVVGVPDDQWGEVVKAYIVLRPSVTMGKDEVVNFCQEHLASYKKPRYVEFVDSLPKNSLGKILKKDLRKLT